jgi:alanyl-tRNA synthetase
VSLEARTHTALHVVKGALAKTLGVQWTTGVAVDGGHGRIAVEFDRKPTDEEMAKTQRLVDLKIGEDAPIEALEMSRRDAEARFGDLIYDKFPLPESIQMLRVFHLPGWNVNACNKDHTRTTGEVGKVTITKIRYRGGKGVLEVSFDVA